MMMVHDRIAADPAIPDPEEPDRGLRRGIIRVAD